MHSLWRHFLIILFIIIFIDSSTSLFSQSPQILRIAAFRVQFVPDDAAATTGDGTFDLGQPSDIYQIDPPPHDRRYFQDHLLFLKNYYRRASKGKLLIEGEVFPTAETEAYQLDFPMSHYNPNTSPDEINRGLANLFKDAIEKADADPEVDFSQFDGFLIFHAGVGKDIDVGFDATPQDIPSLYITQEFLQKYLGIDGIEVDNGASKVSEGALLPETESQEGLQLGLNGMIVANVGSMLGFYDLFSPKTRRSGIGRFGLMDAGLFNGDGLLPALPSAWTRILAGWEEAQTIYQAQGDVFQIHSVLSQKGPTIYKVPINEREYFLLENRYAGAVSLDSLQFVMGQNRDQYPTMKEVLMTYFPEEAKFGESGVLIDIDNPDRALPGSGVLIWHIDENKIEEKLAENAINEDPQHRGVDVEEADGSQDIGQVFDFFSGGAGSELGTQLDFWYRENSAPLFKNEFSPTSIPNSLSYYNRSNSHIKIYDFSSRDSVMTFKVRNTFLQPFFPLQLSLEAGERITSLKVADVNSDGKEDLLLTTSEGRLLALNSRGSAAIGNTIEVRKFPRSINTPPAVFQLLDGSRGIAITTSNGGIFFLHVLPEEGNQYRLFSPAQLGDSISTYPIVQYSQVSNASPQFPPRVFFGTALGRVYQTQFTGTEWSVPEVLSEIPEPIKFIYFQDPVNYLIIGKSGKVYSENGELVNPNPGEYYLPIGTAGIRFTPQGGFDVLSNSVFDFPQDQLFTFDSAPIGVSLSGDPETTLYFIAGNNRLFSFNYNLTLFPNFPVLLNVPEKETRLSFPPLISFLPGSEGNAEQAVVIADPAGVIFGFDFQGNPLPDFPISVGDSLATSPALLDIDGDGDIELAAVTQTGWVYAWDFPTKVTAGNAPFVWYQYLGTPENQNHPVETDLRQSPGSAAQNANLLPAERVFNWPNPATENVTFIRYWLGAPAEVRIKIYDAAGDLVKTLTGSGFPNTYNEVRWDLSDVQSGVYIARIEASSSADTRIEFIKIAVIK